MKWLWSLARTPSSNGCAMKGKRTLPRMLTTFIDAQRRLQDQRACEALPDVRGRWSMPHEGGDCAGARLQSFRCGGGLSRVGRRPRARPAAWQRRGLDGKPALDDSNAVRCGDAR